MERVRQLTRFITCEPILPLDIAASVLLHRKRTINADCERLSEKFEKPEIIGAENIPTCPKPVIIAANHPNQYDLAAGGVNITKAYAHKREELGLPGYIRWMIAENLISRNVSSVIDQRVIYPVINDLIKRLHRTYDFIPVPINYLNGKNQIRERATTILAAKKHLETSQYSTIGIFPEGDFQKDNQLLDFYGGIGTLCRATGTEVLVLPTAIYRDHKDKLIISFGQALNIEPKSNGEEITQRVRTAVESAKQVQ